jgi:hypothetical protein
MEGGCLPVSVDWNNLVIIGKDAGELNRNEIRRLEDLTRKAAQIMIREQEKNRNREHGRSLTPVSIYRTMSNKLKIHQKREPPQNRMRSFTRVNKP